MSAHSNTCSRLFHISANLSDSPTGLALPLPDTPLLFCTKTL
nr:MAG TPA: hypothetical protein [Caudoviricetes sp.]